MTTFGDADPEDAWDEGDTRPEKTALLVRLLVSVALEQRRADHDRERLLARLGFGETKAGDLQGTASPDERPILTAIILGLFYLSVTENA